jgi:hypothetical protein
MAAVCTYATSTYEESKNSSHAGPYIPGAADPLEKFSPFASGTRPSLIIILMGTGVDFLTGLVRSDALVEIRHRENIFDLGDSAVARASKFSRVERGDSGDKVKMGAQRLYLGRVDPPQAQSPR